MVGSFFKVSEGVLKLKTDFSEINMNALELTGQSRTHIIQCEHPEFEAQPDVVDAFLQMRKAAKESGFDLYPVSAFRDFERQLCIWNLKFNGQRPLYSAEGNPIDISGLADIEIVKQILIWSALPGASRHHWGTDIDVADLNAVPENYSIRLSIEETCEGGIFFPLHCWLDKNIHQFGFFRPYTDSQKGVSPEPWHLSFAPAAKMAMVKLDIDLLRSTIQNCQISGKAAILDLLGYIYDEYVLIE